ncbi:MAG: glycosyltransferase [Caldilineaceae bacterium]|nr:glycosyltransferase [Caldilineaceae bacterium]
MNKKTKVAIFLPSLSGGGAERSMLNLAHGIAGCGYPVDLVLAQATGPYLSHVDAAVRIVDLKASRILACLPALVRYLRREEPAALISALNYANIVALWARSLAGIPSQVLVNEQNTLSRSAHNSARRRQRIVPLLVKHFYPWADHVIGNSQGVADDLSQVTGIPRERIQMLYNPVITPEVREKARAALTHPWFRPNQPPVLLAVGRLTKQKDFPTLIQAFAQVRQSRPARLLILGEGPDRPELEALVNQLDLREDVAMPGFVENPYAYMSHASLYVLSSQWEGLPTVLIEALYCGSPIIATDCPSGPREILVDGQHGVLVPMGDVNALAQAIQAGLAGETPQPTAESWHPYSLEAVVDQYLSLLFDGDARKHPVQNKIEQTEKENLYRV